LSPQESHMVTAPNQSPHQVRPSMVAPPIEKGDDSDEEEDEDEGVFVEKRHALLRKMRCRGLHQRVRGKLDFFRKRPRRLVPQIEEGFMYTSSKTGAQLVNVRKLRDTSMTPSGSSLEELGRAGSVSPTLRSLTPAPSMVSLQQRSVRIVELSVERDQRIARAQGIERRQLLDRRVTQLESLLQKAGRKERSMHQQTVLTWVVTALALAELVKSFHMIEHLASDGDRQAMQVTDKSRMMQRVLQVIGQKQAKKELYLSQLRTIKKWFALLRVMSFVSKLRRRLVLNHHVDMIKEFIEVSWRGFSLRKAVSTFNTQMRFLQRALRWAITYYRFMRERIYMPVVWEEETRLLAPVFGMGPEDVERCIKVKREQMKWDSGQALAGISRICNHRRLIWRLGELHPEVRKRIKAAADSERAARMRNLRAGRYRRRRNDPGEDPSDSAKVGQARTESLSVRKTLGASSLTGNIPEPQVDDVMKLIDTNRMSQKDRQDILRTIRREKLELWYQRYKQYQLWMHQFRLDWQQWRLTVSALGPDQKDDWPRLPQIPQYPYEMCMVDSAYIREQVCERLVKAGRPVADDFAV